MDVAVNVDENTAAIIENAGDISGSLPLAGGTMTGQAVGIAPVAAGDMTRKDYVDQAIIDAIAAIPPAGGGFAAGTTMLFADAVAPLGWTLNATHNDKAFRVVNTAGGTSGGVNTFSSVNAQAATAAHVLAATEMPSHAHAGSTFAGAAVSGTFFFGAETYGGSAPYFTASNANTSRNEGAVGGAGGLMTWNYTPSGTVAVAAEGGGLGHSHGISMSMQYVDIILAVIDA